jgi:hypothetical protein
MTLGGALSPRTPRVFERRGLGAIEFAALALQQLEHRLGAHDRQFFGESMNGVHAQPPGSGFNPQIA